ncbi:MAG: TerC family protein [Firmicutes bacterium]|uniref:Integral membrane protein, YjbE family n=1 Tax=Melghirimyces thermohalophilus TaxID=1236220 RepID=A0A1G6HMC5_9BACL|nr:TerC family protein [Melghirimyces thermohalophilus]MDA8353254.1 TerC family protein [Bacillota bacterium]SDB95303.1 integral membrane protein, YjbE family [Melghirimyces thermohalophilus]
MDTQFWFGFFNIIILDLVLSGDNAVVIGMAARKLPDRQRKQVILYGTGAAVLLRVTLTLIAVWLLKVPLLKTVGGLLLIWIAIKLLADEGEEADIHVGQGLRSAIKTIIVADIVMSLDNVLAVAGAAHGNFWLVLFGLALSIPLLMWGSKTVASIMNRLPWLVYVGAGILAYTAGQLIVDDPVIHENVIVYAEFLSWLIPTALVLLVLWVGHAWKEARSHR